MQEIIKVIDDHRVERCRVGSHLPGTWCERLSSVCRDNGEKTGGQRATTPGVSGYCRSVQRSEEAGFNLQYRSSPKSATGSSQAAYYCGRAVKAMGLGSFVDVGDWKRA